ncbi:MAG: DUF2950 family protein [Phycisphaerales bacterium]
MNHLPLIASLLLAALGACGSAAKPGAGAAAIAPAASRVPNAAQTLFDSPQAAVDALAAAARSQDRAALQRIFGPDHAKLGTGDAAEDDRNLQRFSAALAQQTEIVDVGDGTKALCVGRDGWTFPVPLVAHGTRWFFDTDAGVAEMRLRRVGANELATIDVLEALVEAELAYAREDRDADGVLEFAMRLSSTPGTHDGLSWMPAESATDEPMGPVGPALGGAWIDVAGADARPYNGYFYRMLTRQGPGAPGGARDYVENGNMVGGFAFVAYPARYAETGVMTFMVGADGTVYEFDLGAQTAARARAIVSFDPSGWNRTETSP